MDAMSHQYVVVGSGAGGAAVARELAAAGKDVLVVERGEPAGHLGTYHAATRLFDNKGIVRRPLRSKEGVILWRALTTGGSTVVCAGNGVRCLEGELGRLGVDVSAELDELEAELHITPWPTERLSKGGAALRDAADQIGFPLVQMPKFIDPDECGSCGHCVMGCDRGAKWDASRLLKQAVAGGAAVLTGTQAVAVRVDRGHATGVLVRSAQGDAREITAEVVVLAAGGLSTPVILSRSGVPAGDGLFADLFVNVYAASQDLGQVSEPLMAMVHIDRGAGFLLSPYAQQSRRVRLEESGRRGFSLPTKRMLGVMVKTRDDRGGRVRGEGVIDKVVTSADRDRIEQGVAGARRLLEAAGARPETVVVSQVQGAHPGGTAAIGEVVGADLRTPLDGLYVCDASVLPVAPGLPPILTILALGRRLGRQLVA